MRKPYFFVAIFLFFSQIAMAQPQAEKPPKINNYTYEVSKLSHLLWMAIGNDSEVEEDRRLNNTYKFVSDIDATETKDWYDGQGFPMIQGFKGSIEGQFFKVKNLYINRPEEDSVGFIAHGSANISELVFEDVEVIGRDYTGALIGANTRNGPDFTDVVVTGSVKGRNHVGGLFGRVKSLSWTIELSRLFNVAEVEGNSHVGGISGQVIGDRAEVGYCQNYGFISANELVGGLFGKSEVDQLLVSRNINMGTLIADESIGMLVGQGELYRSYENYANSEQANQNINANNCTLLTKTQFASTDNFGDNFNSYHHFVEYPDFMSDGVIPIPSAFYRPFEFSVYRGYQWMKMYLKSMCLASEGFDQKYRYGDTAVVSLQLGAGTKFSHISVNNVDYFENPAKIPITRGMNLRVDIWLEEDYGFEGGDGSLEHPFQIASFEQFEQIAYNINLAKNHYELINDIDGAVTKTRPDGGKFKPVFLNSDSRFNGNYFKIKNVDLSDEFSLFSDNNGSISNIIFDNLSAKGTSSGLFVRSNGGVIENCHVSGNISFNATNSSNYTGMLVGQNYGQIVQSSAIGTLQSNTNLGGLVGQNKGSGTITNCFSKVDLILSNNDRLYGGLVAHNEGAVSLSYAMGGCTFSSTSIYNKYGGVIGKDDAQNNNSGVGLQFDLDVLDPNAYEIIDAGEYGMSTEAFANESRFPYFDFDNVWEIRQLDEIDEHPRPYLHSLIYDKSIDIHFLPTEAEKSKSGNKGYNIGDIAELTVEGQKGYRFSHWQSGEDTLSTDPNYSFEVIDETPIQLFAHFIFDDAEFDVKGSGSGMDPYQITKLEHLEIMSYVSMLQDKSYVLMNDIDASETANWNQGKGFKPLNFRGQFNGQGHQITNLYINRPLENDVAFFGGLIGDIYNLHLRNATVVGLNNVGILAGTAYNKKAIACSVTGRVHGNSKVGGLMGRIQDYDIQYSYAKAEVSGEKRVGGFLGEGMNSSRLIGNYSASMHIGEGEFDPFAASSPIFTIPEQNYFDQDLANSETAKGASALSTKEFKETTSFEGDAWNFETIWQIEQDVNDPFYGRPVHQWDNPVEITAELTEGVTLSPVVGKYIRGVKLMYSVGTIEGYQIASLTISGKKTESKWGPLSMTENSHFIISVNRDQYNIEIDIEGHGEVSPFINSAYHGESHDLAFIPMEGAELLEVFINEESVGYPSIYTLENITADVKVKAVFSRVLANEISSGLKVYPVPATEKLFIEGLHEDKLLHILSLDGRIIKSVEFRKDHAWLDIGSLSSGMYLIKTSSGTIRFIKQ
ncbi:T9SS type A sorting domain-containing protein [Persicobacter diffluens]|uniref:GLUG domain-containing protein n=1 Tax=Persicobacter diffluens TaxID=981 RepID=A0AAN4W453_9BACT|nr:hypothetical protein PEDI_54650 [Persicobacter diffluens]